MALKAVNTAFMRVLPDDHPWAIVRHFLFGHPLKSSSQHKETLGFFLGLPILAIDALSSVAYATEEILIALSVAGTSLYGLSIPIAMAIVLLLASLVASYIQTVQAYPEGGGAYTIARNHLGTIASLIASSSLLIDYTLTVAVSVTAGIRAITSSFPSLLNSQVSLAVLGIFLLTWINLRGLRESARFVSPFAYIFIFCMLLMGALGVFTYGEGLSEAGTVINESIKSHPIKASTLWWIDLAVIPIVLRAFAGGCTAMTGIEAIANAGSMLNKPHAKIAQQILLALGILLGIMFLSVTITAHNLGLLPLPNESLLSQITRTLWGNGIAHDFFQILTAIILFFAANTAFAGAPKLSAMLARDGWLPKQLYIIGDRLVFSQGIILLALVASSLVILFQGDTHRLIPLYAIGVFTAFTISQMGMVIYWRHCPKHNSYKYLRPSIKAFINGFGAFLTAIALLTTFEAKFKEGAFLVLIAVPMMIGICLWIRRHYQRITVQLQVDQEFITSRQHDFSNTQIHPVIVPISQLNRPAIEAIAFAREMSKDVRVVIVDLKRHNAHDTSTQLKALGWEVDVVILSSPYRSVVRPIINYVHQVDRENQRLAVLILPETVPIHWWENILHNKTAQTIVKALSWSETIESQARVIINIPYYLKRH